MGRIALPLLYGGPRPIDEKKLKNILELLEFVPPVYHEFYEALISTAAADTSSSEKDYWYDQASPPNVEF